MVMRNKKNAIIIMSIFVALILFSKISTIISENQKRAECIKWEETAKITQSCMPWLIRIPDTGRIPCKWKTKACEVQELAFTDSELAIRIHNPYSNNTNPDLYVGLYDVNGQELEVLHPVRYVFKDFKPGMIETKMDSFSNNGSITFVAVKEGDNAHGPSSPVQPQPAPQLQFTPTPDRSGQAVQVCSALKTYLYTGFGGNGDPQYATSWYNNIERIEVAPSGENGFAVDVYTNIYKDSDAPVPADAISCAVKGYSDANITSVYVWGKFQGCPALLVDKVSGWNVP